MYILNCCINLCRNLCKNTNTTVSFYSSVLSCNAVGITTLHFI